MDNLNQFRFFIEDADVFYKKMYNDYLNNYENLYYYNNEHFCFDLLGKNSDFVFIDNPKEFSKIFQFLDLKEYNPDITIVTNCSMERSKKVRESLNFGSYQRVIRNRKIFNEIALFIESNQATNDDFNFFFN
jgi:hypothetical protein